MTSRVTSCVGGGLPSGARLRLRSDAAQAPATSAHTAPSPAPIAPSMPPTPSGTSDAEINKSFMVRLEVRSFEPDQTMYFEDDEQKPINFL